MQTLVPGAYKDCTKITDQRESPASGRIDTDDASVLVCASSRLRSVPLLKFHGEQPVLCEEGLEVGGSEPLQSASVENTLDIAIYLVLVEAINALPGPLCPIAFVGDGRSGKSYLPPKSSPGKNPF